MVQTLLSVPPNLGRALRRPDFSGKLPPVAFVGHDPIGARLGSGGGTAHLLHNAWRRVHRGKSFWNWLASEQSLVLHAGGESRRLPSYAAVGKALMPIPGVDGKLPRRFDQTLIDFQVPAYAQILQEAGRNAVVLVASGDVWLDLNPVEIPPVASDITGIGMRVSPEVAQHFGVFFVAKPRGGRRLPSQPIEFFLQKPAPLEIYRHLSHHDFYVDTGLWLLSMNAVRLLFRRCGWDEKRQAFATPDAHPSHLDLYTEFGAALGGRSRAPASLAKLGWSRLTSSVIALEDARFFHLGSSRQLFESFEQLSRSDASASGLFHTATVAELRPSRPKVLPVWLDGAGADRDWTLKGQNIVTGHIPGMPPLRLEMEQCLEIAPVGAAAYVFRPYVLDDKLRGSCAASGAGRICGHAAHLWLERRGFASSPMDVFQLPIYPVLRVGDVTPALLNWFFTDAPDPELSRKIRQLHLISAAEIPPAVNFNRHFASRAAGYLAALQSEFAGCVESGDTRVMSQDFAAIATLCHGPGRRFRSWLLRHRAQLFARLSLPEHRSRFLILLADLTRGETQKGFIAQAHRELRDGMLSAGGVARAEPRLMLKEDQIVWSRSPVRLDLAGGWTDTPPYCLAHGGAVINVAVLLNGQPPIQVFVRPLAEPEFRLRSIDLGSTELIQTFAELSTYRDPRSNFSLPKAALAMAGFHPEFCARKTSATLRGQLKAFGSGLEISLLSAVPKGSGLGTSSILAATILGALNRACGLGWDEVSLYNRVLGVEQLLTTGGGWQDQAGALFPGLKLIQTEPGAAQTPSVRYLPTSLFGAAAANQTLLLYYTGITRLAKGILKEIVHDMFLGRFETLQTLGFIRANAFALFNALQQGNAGDLHRCIARSWDLNKRLDPGTTTPAIEGILRACGPDLTAAKLLGAGGGGYILLCAANVEAGRRIRALLEANPPNSRARFIDFQVTERGLEVTVS